jgi:hypothetical protein
MQMQLGFWQAAYEGGIVHAATVQNSGEGRRSADSGRLSAKKQSEKKLSLAVLSPTGSLLTAIC